jgi:hypothetical protein
MSKRFTSKNPSTPQGKRGRLRNKRKEFNKYKEEGKPPFDPTKFWDTVQHVLGF